MAIFAVGDVQGCHLTLMTLVENIRFDPARDRLWLVGDLVNRGPRSLEVLRWARGLGDRLTVVLGNHDLHLIALGLDVGKGKPRDTLDAVLEAPDGPDLIEWLRRRPLLHHEPPYVLVHAGLLPLWTVAQAVDLAREVEGALRGPQARPLLSRYRDADWLQWKDNLSGPERGRVILNAFTRLRTCTPSGLMCLDFSGRPKEAPAGCLPWFSIPRRESGGATVIFGHWAALGFRTGPDFIALDSGCVWGGKLTAVRLEDGAVFQVGLRDA